MIRGLLCWFQTRCSRIQDSSKPCARSFAEITTPRNENHYMQYTQPKPCAVLWRDSNYAAKSHMPCLIHIFMHTVLSFLLKPGPHQARTLHNRSASRKLDHHHLHQQFQPLHPLLAAVQCLLCYVMLCYVSFAQLKVWR